jgi:hypothetical protein
MVDLEDYNVYLEVYAWFLLWNTYTSFHYKICIELSKTKFHWIKGGCETTLCHASYDTLYGPNQFFPKFLLNFKS